MTFKARTLVIMCLIGVLLFGTLFILFPRSSSGRDDFPIPSSYCLGIFADHSPASPTAESYLYVRYDDGSSGHFYPASSEALPRTRGEDNVEEDELQKIADRLNEMDNEKEKEEEASDPLMDGTESEYSISESSCLRTVAIRESGLSEAGNGAFRVAGELTVPEDETLTVSTVNELRMAEGSSLRIYGNLNLGNDYESRAKISALNGTWGGMHVYSGTTALYNVDISGSERAVTVHGGAVDAAEITVKGCDTGIEINDGDLSLHLSHIQAKDVGLRARGGNVEVVSSIFQGSDTSVLLDQQRKDVRVLISGSWLYSRNVGVDIRDAERYICHSSAYIGGNNGVKVKESSLGDVEITGCYFEATKGQAIDISEIKYNSSFIRNNLIEYRKGISYDMLSPENTVVLDVHVNRTYPAFLHGFNFISGPKSDGNETRAAIESSSPPSLVYPTNNSYIKDLVPTLVVRPNGYVRVVSTDPSHSDPYYLDNPDGYYIRLDSDTGFHITSKYYGTAGYPNGWGTGDPYPYPMFTPPEYYWNSWCNWSASAYQIGPSYESGSSATWRFYRETGRPKLPRQYITGTHGPFASGHADSITVSFNGASDSPAGLYGYNIDVLKAESIIGNNAFEYDKDGDGVADGWYEGELDAGSPGLGYVNVNYVEGQPYNGLSQSTCVQVDDPGGNTHYALNTKLQKEIVEGRDLTFSIDAKGTGSFSVVIVPRKYTNGLPGPGNIDNHAIPLISSQTVQAAYARYDGTAYIPETTDPEISYYVLHIRWDSGGTMYFDNATLVYGDWKGTTPAPFKETKWLRGDQLHTQNTWDLNKRKLYQGVYYDSTYGTGNGAYWVSNPNNVVSFLGSRGFDHLNAGSLQSFLANRISGGNAHRSVVVMASGNVPQTVCDLNTAAGTQLNLDASSWSDSNTPHPMNQYPLIVEYMIQGGTIVWLGDVPFYHVTSPGANASTWGYEGQRHLLGTCIMQRNIYWATGLGSVEGNITPEGVAMGVSVKDTAIRPIPYNECTTALTDAWANIGGVGRHIALSWHKNFNTGHPLSGFVRYRAESFDGSRMDMLEDVYRLATYCHLDHSADPHSVTFTHDTTSPDTELPDNSFYTADVAAVDNAGNIASGASWGFDNPGDFEGWEPNDPSNPAEYEKYDVDLSKGAYENGAFKLVTSGGSGTATPHIVNGSVDITPSNGQMVIVNMEVNPAVQRFTEAQVWWVTSADGAWDTTKMAKASTIPNVKGEYTYIFDVGGNPKWYNGVLIEEIAFLPFGAAAYDNDYIWLDFIKIGWAAADRTAPHVEIDLLPDDPNEGQQVIIDAFPATEPSSSDLGLGLDESTIEWDFDITVDTNDGTPTGPPDGDPANDVDAVGSPVEHIYWEGGNNAGLGHTDYVLRCRLDDLAGNHSETDIPIRVYNVAPQITSLPVTTAMEDVPYTYVVMMHDVANDNPDGVVHDITSGRNGPNYGSRGELVMDIFPAGMTVLQVDETTARLDWIPDQSAVDETIQFGGVHVRIHPEDDDGGIGNHQDFYIKVSNTNDPPSSFRLSRPPVPSSLSKPTSAYVPGNEPTVGVSRPTFKWEKADDPDPNDEDIVYRFQIISSPVRISTTLPSSELGWDSYSSLVEVNNISTTQHTLSFDLSDDTWYYWRVIAMDEHGASRVSNSWDDNFCYHEFHTVFSYDLAVASVSPVAVMVNQRFEFSVMINNVGYSFFDSTQMQATVVLDIDNDGSPDGTGSVGDLYPGESYKVVIPSSGHFSFANTGPHEVHVEIQWTKLNPSYDEDVYSDNDMLDMTLVVVRPVSTTSSFAVDPMLILMIIGLALFCKQKFGKKGERQR